MAREAALERLVEADDDGGALWRTGSSAPPTPPPGEGGTGEILLSDDWDEADAEAACACASAPMRRALEPAAFEAPGQRRRRRRRAAGAAMAASALLLLSGFAATSSQSGSPAERLRGLFGGRQDPGIVELALGEEPAIDGVNCFIDTYQAVLRLANAATSIVASENVCKDQSTDNLQARCSGFVNSALYNMVFVVGMIAQAVSDCAGTLNRPAACVASVSGLVGNLDVIAGAASSATQTCNLWWKGLPPPKYGVTTVTTTTNSVRRLQAPMAVAPTAAPSLPWPPVPKEFIDNGQDKLYKTSMVNCWVNTNQGALFLMRAGLIIRDSTKSCTPETTGSEIGKRHCAVNVIGLLGALALAARFISLAVPSCQGFKFNNGGPTGEAACAADVAGVAAGLFAALAPGMQLDIACGSGKLDADQDRPDYYEYPDGRRLASASPEMLELDPHWRRALLPDEAAWLEGHGFFNATAFAP